MIKSQTNKILFAVKVKKKLYFYYINIITIFLNLFLEEKIYIKLLLIFNNKNKNQIFFLF